jgi:hypothetical protein
MTEMATVIEYKVDFRKSPLPVQNGKFLIIKESKH